MTHNEIEVPYVSDEAIKKMYPDVGNDRAQRMAAKVNGYIAGKRVRTRDDVEAMITALYNGETIPGPDEESTEPFSYPDAEEKICAYRNYLMRQGIAKNRKEAVSMDAEMDWDPRYYLSIFLMKHTDQECDDSDPAEIWGDVWDDDDHREALNQPEGVKAFLQAVQNHHNALSVLSPEMLQTIYERLDWIFFDGANGIIVDYIQDSESEYGRDICKMFLEIAHTLSEAGGADYNQSVESFFDAIARNDDYEEEDKIACAVRKFSEISGTPIPAAIFQKLSLQEE